MYSYVTQDLPQAIAANFSVRSDRQGIFGHSMGGHGALICALKNPDRYLSVSAFAPIAAPTRSAWGQKAFAAYLGEDRQAWAAYDASELVKTTQLNGTILIDQGTADSFYQQQQLLPEIFAENCQAAGQAIDLRLQKGYDHSYFAIATFIGDHLRHHARILLANTDTKVPNG
jgi:S-formylglutathione hydrolase